MYVVKEMIEECNLDDKPVYVVAITGEYRSGKSFLLSLLKTYIDYYAEVKLWVFSVKSQT